MRRSLLGALVLYGWTIFGILSSAHYFLGEEAKSGTASLDDIAGHVHRVLLGVGGADAARAAGCCVARRDAGATAMRDGRRSRSARRCSCSCTRRCISSAVQLVGVEPVTPIGAAELRDYAMRHAGGDVATVAVLAAVYLLLRCAAAGAARARWRRAALEARVASADLEVLRWQLQPHFLFNALNTVSTLVLKGDNARADDAIGRISRYLRSALAQRADAMVTRERTRCSTWSEYFAIERLRFGDALVLDARIEDGARAVRIPALVLQPLVENAIRHGLAPASGETRIGVCAAVVREQRLRIRVTRSRRRPRLRGSRRASARRDSGCDTCASGCATSTATVRA